MPVHAESNFFPTADDLRPHIGVARLVMLNSPLNPTGTAIAPAQLTSICQLIVEENHRRARSGQKAVWLCYDQVYWQLVFPGAGQDIRHVTPPELVPEIAPYTVILDAASKSFAATGMRVGWAVLPPAARQRMADILGHVGAWAPRAKQVAMAALLDDDAAVTSYLTAMRARVWERLARLAEGFAGMSADGLPVEVIPHKGRFTCLCASWFPGAPTSRFASSCSIARASRSSLSGFWSQRGQRVVSHFSRCGVSGGHRCGPTTCPCGPSARGVNTTPHRT